jgi:hypothetical protein
MKSEKEELDLTEEELRNLGLEIFSKEERNILALFAKALFGKLYAKEITNKIESFKRDRLELANLRRCNSEQRQELEWFYKRCSNAVYVNYNPIVLVKEPPLKFGDIHRMKKKILNACSQSMMDLHENIRNPRFKDPASGKALHNNPVDYEILATWQVLEKNIDSIVQTIMNKFNEA